MTAKVKNRNTNDSINAKSANNGTEDGSLNDVNNENSAYSMSSSMPLGYPLPLDEHACSVSLPTWSSIVGYEEGLPSVTNALACGYPRFVYHPYVIRLMEAALEVDASLQKEMDTEGVGGWDSWDCLVLPSRQSAMRCHDFLVKACGLFDHNASSPRLLHDSVSTTGNVRIGLFSPDNAIDIHADVENEAANTDGLYCAINPVRVLDLKSAQVHAVIFPAQTSFAIEAKSYWQHTGEIVSSRRAEAALVQLNKWNNSSKNSENSQSTKTARVTSPFYKEAQPQCLSEQWKTCPWSDQPHMALYPSSPPLCEANPFHNDNGGQDTADKSSFEEIKKHIASITFTLPEEVFLAPSGMASIYAALRSARRRKVDQNNKTLGGLAIVYGFPYRDTLKMCSRSELVPGGVEFFGHGHAEDMEKLSQMLANRAAQSANGDANIAALVTEYPSNPLLNCPDLNALRSLADQYDFALVVDDTIGNFANVDLLTTGLADVVCTSLTKLFNGRGDAIAGSIIANTRTKIGRWMQQDLLNNHHSHEGLWLGDAVAVHANSIDFLSRSTKINHTAEALADWLNTHEDVSAVYYPKFTCPDGYKSVLNKNDVVEENGASKHKHHPGYGGLMSILLHSHVCQRTFYDKLNVCKGPSLGTNFTLVCPYTLLAHYHELDFATSYNVQPNLLRIAIGLEDLDTLKEKFQEAFHESRLYPKLSVPDARTSTNDGSIGVNARGYCTVSTGTAYTQSHCRNFLSKEYSRLGGGLFNATSLISSGCTPNSNLVRKANISTRMGLRVPSTGRPYGTTSRCDTTDNLNVVGAILEKVRREPLSRKVMSVFIRKGK